ncbi:HVO_0234 family beta-propeller protein, partial [Natrinema soli]
WMAVLEGAFDTVGADPRSEPGRLVRAHAVTDETIYEYAPDDDAWRESDRSADSVIGFGYGETTYAVTEKGTFLAASDGEWRTRTLGVRDVTGIAIPR